MKTKHRIQQNPSNPTQKGIVEPYKGIEFDKFLRQIGNANALNWSILADVLGVNRETIVRWKKHPLARAVISQAIEENISKMTAVGASDWKMYHQKLKMLGVNDKSTLKSAYNGNISEALDRLERTDYAKIAEEAKKEIAHSL